MKHLQSIFVLATHDERAFINAFEKIIVAVGKEDNVIASMKTDNSYSFSAAKLSRIWGIRIPAAKQTLEATTQKGMRAVAYPSVERRWPTGDRPLRCRRLNHHIYHDTLNSLIKSLRRNTCSEI
jgi:hypothetical protein